MSGANRHSSANPGVNQLPSQGIDVLTKVPFDLPALREEPPQARLDRPGQPSTLGLTLEFCPAGRASIKSGFSQTRVVAAPPEYQAVIVPLPKNPPIITRVLAPRAECQVLLAQGLKK
jgi:hypothetical protein